MMPFVYQTVAARVTEDMMGVDMMGEYLAIVKDKWQP